MGLAANATPARCCIVLQQTLENIMGAKAPGNITQETGFINALLGARNTNGFEKIQPGIAGKGLPTNGQGRPEVEIKFKKPYCGTVAEGQLELCDTQTAIDPYGYRRLEIPTTNAFNLGFSITQSDFDRVCEGRDEVIAENLISIGRSMRYELEKRVIALFYANVGEYVNGVNSGTSPKTLNLFTVNANGAYANPNAFLDLKSEFRRMLSNDAPIVVGDDQLARWFDSRSMGGLGANSLFANPNDFGGFSPATSLFLNSAINDVTGNPTEMNLLSWLPGTAQLITWNKFVGDWEIARDDYFTSTITIDGITYDYSMNYNKCTFVWDIGLGITYDLFNLNDELDPCYNWNYLLRYLVDCGEDTCANLLPTPESESV